MIEDEGFAVEKSISCNFTNFLPKLFGGFSYFLAIIQKMGDLKNIKKNKQMTYQDMNLFFTKVFGFTALGADLLIIARKNW